MLRKAHKEKMKKMEVERAKLEEIDLAEKNSRSCFSWMGRKMHPRRISSVDYAGKEEERCDNKR